ncbi:MAG: inorganic phosphate transporter [Candidatus Kerfeldbacteria bacterium]
MYELTLLILIFIAALAYDVVNGFHDAANSIAMSIWSNALSPRNAIILAVVFNFAGALSHTAVAYTIGKGVVSSDFVTGTILFAALMSAISWGMFTWKLGLPSSSTHALVGGLIGSALVASNFDFSVLIAEGITKIIVAMFLAPFAGFIGGFLLLAIIIWPLYGLNKGLPKLKPPTNRIYVWMKQFRSRRNSFWKIALLILPIYWPYWKLRVNKRPTNRVFKVIQIGSAAWMSFTHGMNDAQNAMGIITMSLLSYGALTEFTVPLSVRILCALAMGVGTMIGGWKIIKTVINQLAGEECMPIEGFAAQTAAGGVIFGMSLVGAPISTSHSISSTVLGVNGAHGLKGINWGKVGEMIFAWIVTIPATAIISAIIWYCFHLFGSQ